MVNRGIRAVSVALVMSIGAVALVACSGGGGSTPSKSAPSSSDAQPALAVQSGGGASTSSGSTESGAPANATAASASSSVADWDRKIIRNADISLQVADVESMLVTIRTIVDSASGTVFASSTSYNGDSQIASMTLDVPAEQFDQVVNQLRSAQGVKKVEREQISSQDVTDQYVDLQSQLRNLQTTQARLQALMSQATQLQDVLTIQQELANVEGQIEQTTGRINYLDKHTSFSRITVTLTPFAIAADTGPKSGTDLGKAVHQAWKASLAFTGGVLTGLVKTAVFLWWFWPFALVAAIIWLTRRQRRRDATGGSEIAV